MAMTKARFLRLVAEIIFGTEVPRSIGVLGAAAPAWDELYRELNLGVYADADAIEEALTAWVKSKE